MNQGIISRRYATALWMYALKKGHQEEVYAETKRLCSNFTQYDSLKRVLSNRLLTQEKKIAVLSMIIGEPLSETFQNFIRLIFARSREKFLRTICLSFEMIYLRENRMLPAKLVTATPVDKSIEQRFIQKLEKNTGQKVCLETQVNPALIGGYVVTVDTYRLDASVSNRLKQIKEKVWNTLA